MSQKLKPENNNTAFESAHGQDKASIRLCHRLTARQHIKEPAWYIRIKVPTWLRQLYCDAGKGRPKGHVSSLVTSFGLIGPLTQGRASSSSSFFSPVEENTKFGAKDNLPYTVWHMDENIIVVVYWIICSMQWIRLQTNYLPLCYVETIRFWGWTYVSYICMYMYLLYVCTFFHN